MNRTWKLIPLAIAGALALSACTGDATRSDVAYDDDTTSKRDDTRSSAPAARTQPAPAATTQAAPKRAPAAPAGTTTPALADDELVGVEACDDYLETYRGCHRALGMYPPDSIEARFQQLRSSFVARATDPATHESLERQCESLAEDMETALDGRDCAKDVDVIAESSLEDAIGDDTPDRP